MSGQAEMVMWGVLVFLFLFFMSRYLINWYFKINHRHTEQKRSNDLMQEIIKNQEKNYILLNEILKKILESNVTITNTTIEQE